MFIQLINQCFKVVCYATLSGIPCVPSSATSVGNECSPLFSRLHWLKPLS